MPQEKYEYMEIGIFLRFHCKDGYVGFDICWNGWKNWFMMNMMMMMMVEIKTMMMYMMNNMMSLSLKTLP
jgi:hypothetical protein